MDRMLALAYFGMLPSASAPPLLLSDFNLSLEAFT